MPLWASQDANFQCCKLDKEILLDIFAAMYPAIHKSIINYILPLLSFIDGLNGYSWPEFEDVLMTASS